MRGGVGVAAHDRHAGLREAQLRADDVDDALVGVAQGVQANPELTGVLAQRVDLGATGDVGDGAVNVDRRSVVVLGCESQVGSAHLASGEAKTFEGLGAGDLVDQVKVDVEQVGGTVLTLGDGVVAPHFLRHCSAHCSSLAPRHRRRARRSFFVH